jgi:predicted amidophosphoribosyltransferase
MSVRELDSNVHQCILVVDDVITSGSTLREAARVLRKAGVTQVFGAALSHTEG